MLSCFLACFVSCLASSFQLLFFSLCSGACYATRLGARYGGILARENDWGGGMGVRKASPKGVGTVGSDLAEE